MTEEQRIKKILSDLGDTVAGPSDFFGDAKPSFLFWPMVKLMRPLLSCDPDKMISKTSIRIRKILHPIFLRLLPAFMKYKQVIERKIEIPQEPVIWCPTHCFEDDIAASIGAARHAYILFGSIPALFNRLDGVGAYVNGVVICNRKVKASKRAATEASAHLLDMGMDLILFPEGVWNKTPDKLLLDFWPGAYRLAKETGCKIVPVIHYLADPHEKYDGNVIHTVIADPISMDGLDEREGQALLRDTMATWYYYLMKKYGQSTREELLDGFETADDAWESYIAMHTGCVKYYDREIELCADYRPKQIVRPEDVWQSVANIQNVHAGNASHVRYARALVEREKRRDFQRRF
ncbi:MAG: 1-acyl-sn-glycerol-3-phosphate acyltransferase [Clostridiales bacterium]|nr:1-acyl-sn-glycerol-3-phosphate acyltransferase [Clostridiales bacterium]MCI7574982.1 1-acyl-sn-glycerol-3-phosphate acyltransferase [Clostridiales bacterium]